MNSSSSGIRSYDALARAALKHPEWPQGSKPKSRSLAALLGKLDRGQELDWLADRSAVQQVLADVLGASAAAVSRAVGRDLDQSDQAADRVRLDDVRFARPLMLREESLPPGIPPLATRPRDWHRVLWRAGVGQGRTLTGTWLAARGLATFVQEPAWSDAARHLGHSAPLFVELLSATAGHELLSDLPPGPICVAAAFDMDPSALTSAGWSVIESPSPVDYVEDLVDWVGERLPRDGNFPAENATEWLRKAIDEGMANSLGALFGLIGVFDELGARTLDRLTGSKLAETFVTRRLLQSIGKESADASWLRKEGWDLVRGLARRLLTDSEDPWFAARSLDEWVRLVPLEYQRSVDADWVRFSLSRSASPVTVREIERALRELPPGGFRVVQSLRNAGILRADHASDRFVFAPAWLSEITRKRALQELARASPFEWGEALVRSHATSDVVAHVRAEMERDGGWIDEVVELESTENPAHVAALELAFRLAGLERLRGPEPAASSNPAALWDIQLELAVAIDDLPHPRLEYPGAVAERTPELLTGAWYLAALSLSETLETHEGRRHLLLRPWLLTRPPPAFERVLDWIAEVVVAYPSARWAIGAFELVSRLREVLDSPLTAGGVHLLEAPAVLLGSWARGALGPGELEAVAPFPVLLTATEQLARARNLPWIEVADALWRVWDAAGQPEWSWLRVEGRSLWPHVPLEVLDRLLGAENPPRIGYADFDSERWDLVVDHRRRRGEPPGLWEFLPGSRWTGALRDRLPDRATLSSLWKRDEGLLRAEFLGRLEDDPEGAMALARAAPEQAARELVQAAEERITSAALAAEPAVAWLFDRVRARGPDWQAAFRLLSQLSTRPE